MKPPTGAKENTVVFIELEMRCALNAAITLGEVTDIAASSADTVDGIRASTTYTNDNRRVAVQLISSAYHHSSTPTTIDSMY